MKFKTPKQLKAVAFAIGTFYCAMATVYSFVGLSVCFNIISGSPDGANFGYVTTLILFVSIWVGYDKYYD